MNTDKSIWLEIDITDINSFALAKAILPQCEYPVRCLKPNEVRDILKTKNESLIHKLLVPRFHYVTKEEEKDILNGVWDENKKYDEGFMPYGLYFPYLSIADSFLVIPNLRNTSIDKLLEPHYTEEDGSYILQKQMLCRTVFTILHEFGHYISYKKFHNKKDYALFVHKSKEKYSEYCKSVRNGEIRPCTETQNDLYRNAADEYEADHYALESLDLYMSKALLWIIKNR